MYYLLVDINGNLTEALRVKTVLQDLVESCITYARPLNQLNTKKTKYKTKTKQRKEGEEKTDKKKENDVFYPILKAGVSKMKAQAG